MVRSSQAPSRRALGVTAVRAGMRTGAALSVAAAVALSGAAPVLGAADPADRREQVRKEISRTKADLVDLTAAGAAAVRALQTTNQRIGAAQTALTRARAREQAARDRKLQLDVELAMARQEVEAGTALLAANAAQTRLAQDKRDDMARQAYQGGGMERISIAFDTDSARILSERLYIVDAVAERQGQAIGDLNAARQLQLTQQNKLVVASEKVRTLTVEAAENVAEALSAKQAAIAARDSLVTLRARQKKQLAAVNARKASEQKQLTSLQAESARITALLKKRARDAAKRRAKAKKKTTSAGTTPRSNGGGGGYFSYPVNGRISSGFGKRYHPILHYWRLHAGVDFSIACGTPVYAAGYGQVVDAGWAGGYGNHVVIEHSGPLATTYNHLSKIVKHSGTVRPGQLIAYSGTTGLSTGCHLHFEVRRNGSPVNPMNYLR